MRMRFLTLALLALTVATTTWALEVNDRFSGRCAAVLDGDTLVVETAEGEVVVHLWAVDAPELAQPWGDKARYFLRDMAEGERVRARVQSTDGAQVTATVHAGGRDLGELMAANGLAWAIGGPGEGEHIRILAGTMRDLGVGLWSDPEPTPPWEFRQEDPRAR